MRKIKIPLLISLKLISKNLLISTERFRTFKMCDKPYTSSDKMTASVVSGLVFLVTSSPSTYAITNNITSRIGMNIMDSQGKPNLAGLLIHSLFYVAIIRIMMNRTNNECVKPYTSKDKWIVALIGGLLFLMISSPFLYDTVNAFTSSFGLNTTAPDGSPNLTGLSLHTLIFTSITRILMR